MTPLRIGIAGGSLGGLFAAVLLEAAGHDVSVFERSTRGLEGRGAGLVPQREVYAILQRIGCEHVSHIGVVATERIFFDRAGRIVQRHRTPQTQVSWDLLFRTVRERLHTDRYQLGREAVSTRDAHGGAILSFADGSDEAFDLVLGADGIGSAIRPAIVGRDHEPSYAGYAAWRVLVPEADLAPSADILLDRFAFFDVPGSQVLGYLVPGPDGSTAPGHRRYNCVWYRQAPAADGSLGRALTDLYGQQHPFSISPGAMSADARSTLVQDAERLLPPAFAGVWAVAEAPFVQGIFDYEAPSMASGRIALLGDAAFVVRPHTAMGLSKAAGDAMAFADAVARSETVSDALTAYARTREAVGREIAAYGRRLGSRLG